MRRAAMVTASAMLLLALSACASAEESDPTTPDAGDGGPWQATPAPDPAETEAVDVDQDPDLRAIADAVLVDSSVPVKLIWSSDVQAHCEVEASGCYTSPDDTIYVNDEVGGYQLVEIVAHEYLHYFWNRDGLENDADLAAALDAAAADPEGLGGLVPDWLESYVEDDGTIMPTELFSYSCTGMTMGQMSAEIREACETYLNLDAIPANQVIDVGELEVATDQLRAAEGLDAIPVSDNAVAASQARAATITPTSQVPLDEYPDEVRAPLDGGCAPASYTVSLHAPRIRRTTVLRLSDLVDGILLSDDALAYGFATETYPYIDASSIFDENTLRVNATLVVLTVCTQ